jgi:hypothetical protein
MALFAKAAHQPIAPRCSFSCQTRHGKHAFAIIRKSKAQRSFVGLAASLVDEDAFGQIMSAPAMRCPPACA